MPLCIWDNVVLKNGRRNQLCLYDCLLIERTLRRILSDYVIGISIRDNVDGRMVYMGLTYYLPCKCFLKCADVVYFQAVRGESALMSGVCLLPYILTCCIVSATIGRIVTYFGRYNEVHLTSSYFFY